MLEVKNLEKTYPQPGVDIQVLRGLNLSMQPGEVVAIIGQSGAGKSTLLSMLAGLDTPTKGEVVIAGQHIENMKESDLARFRAKNLGIVFQQFHLISTLTAVENVSLALEIAGDPAAHTQAVAALERVGLKDRLHHFPSKLSGGECQRVAIARAFVGKPSLLLADEPSGNLDSATGKSVMQILFDNAKSQNTTMLLVTHSHDLAKRCQQIFRLQNGILVKVQADDLA